MIPRCEHPKPQMMRESWMNLNGEWDFAIDNANSGEARKLQAAENTPAVLEAFRLKIVVPFCPQSKLSGIRTTDFIRSVWYRRSVRLTAAQCKGHVFLHFGACDYRTAVWVNGQLVGVHKGGYVSFRFDISSLVRAGDNVITLQARDDERDPMIPSGKQCMEFSSRGCFYTRTTGIWQTVWLEFTPDAYIDSIRIMPNVDTQSVSVTAELKGSAPLSVDVLYQGKKVGEAALKKASGEVTLQIPLAEKHLWEIGKGRLYDLHFTFGKDVLKSYFGLRKIEYTDREFLLNGKSVFQRLVLDQGFYPDGIYTAPSDEELLADVKRSQAVGFNGARLHEKIFEERFLYHCDREGYIVWGEYPNWGLDHTDPLAVYPIMHEWVEELKRDMNHPSIVGWCPFNETWDQHYRRQHNDVLAMVYEVTKAVDPSRPCIDTSGNYHVDNITDIYDVHDYEGDPAKLAANFASLAKDRTYQDRFHDRQNYRSDKPFFVSEYGGIGWAVGDGAWGYGNIPKTKEAFMERLKGLTDVLLDNPNIFAFCYTQLTDIEQEQNGIYTYKREPKFPPEELAEIFGRKAAIEK
ncbi:MAG: beta-galactosidase [Clostridia bacterium]|nr:beta-galactosidase [Clostridia bacterium]